MTAKTCKPCLSSDVRDLIAEAFPKLAEVLAPVPSCPDGQLLDLCIKKRSAYQEFTSACMKGKSGGGFNPAAMKECAAEWKSRKVAA